MVKKVIQCDVTKEGRIRPEFLSVGKNVAQNIKELIRKRVIDKIKFENDP